MSVLGWLKRLLGLAERAEKIVEVASSARPPPIPEPELEPISLSPRAILRHRLPPPPRPPRKD